MVQNLVLAHPPCPHPRGGRKHPISLSRGIQLPCQSGVGMSIGFRAFPIRRAGKREDGGLKRDGGRKHSTFNAQCRRGKELGRELRELTRILGEMGNIQLRKLGLPRAFNFHLRKARREDRRELKGGNIQHSTFNAQCRAWTRIARINTNLGGNGKHSTAEARTVKGVQLPPEESKEGGSKRAEGRKHSTFNIQHSTPNAELGRELRELTRIWGEMGRLNCRSSDCQGHSTPMPRGKELGRELRELTRIFGEMGNILHSRRKCLDGIGPSAER